jgi:hypothetical protein
MTHTFVVLKISQAAWDEIAEALRKASYDHVFRLDGDGQALIDMHGIALGSPGASIPQAPEPSRVKGLDTAGIVYCRAHDFGLCPRHREDCLNSETIPCQLAAWPEHASRAPYCSVCEGRLKPKARPEVCPDRPHEHDSEGRLIFFGNSPEPAK